MQIVIRLEQKDFEGNKEVFDRMYGLCSVLNKKDGTCGDDKGGS